ncbi:MAG: hypothetical protein ACK56I_22495, partial [bacterium]
MGQTAEGPRGGLLVGNAAQLALALGIEEGIGGGLGILLVFVGGVLEDGRDQAVAYDNVGIHAVDDIVAGLVPLVDIHLRTLV